MSPRAGKRMFQGISVPAEARIGQSEAPRKTTAAKVASNRVAIIARRYGTGFVLMLVCPGPPCSDWSLVQAQVWQHYSFMSYQVDLNHWCENCKRVTAHRVEDVRPSMPSVFGKMRLYCRECGQLTREVVFK
jgi:hypothetical protein